MGSFVVLEADAECRTLRRSGLLRPGARHPEELRQHAVDFVAQAVAGSRHGRHSPVQISNTKFHDSNYLADKTASLYRDTILPQTRQTLDVDQKPYAQGKVDFDRVIRPLGTALARIEQVTGEARN
jgi:hypothetical protein